MAALNELVQAGKVRALGASAMYGYQFYNLQLTARDHGYSPLASGRLARPTWSADTLRSKTDRVARGKYDHTFESDHKIAKRVYELSEKYNATMAQVAIAWQWSKGVSSPIIGATKAKYLDDAVEALNLNLTSADINYLEELYVPHKIVGAIDHNPPEGVVLLDVDKT